MHGFRLPTEESKSMSLLLFLICLTPVASKDILELLLGEVRVIVPVGMGISFWVVPIILPCAVSTHILLHSVAPNFQLQIRDRPTLIVIANNHGSLVRLVIYDFGSQVPLLLFPQAFQDVIGADLHDGDLVVEAGVFALIGSANLVFPDFPHTPLRNELRSECHVF